MAPLDTRVCLEEQELSYEISVLPSGIKEGYILSGENLGLLKGAKKEAYEFAEYLYTPANRWRLLDATGTLPMFREEYIQYEEQGELTELNDAFMRNGEVLKNYNSWFEISDVLANSLHILLTKRNLDLSEEARELQDKVRVAIMNN